MGDSLTKSSKRAESVPVIPVPRQFGAPDDSKQAARDEARQEAKRQAQAKAAAREEARKRAIARRSATEQDLASPELRGHAPRPMQPRVVIDAPTSKAAREAEAAEILRLMENWARWKSGAGVAAPVSQAWTLEAKGTRSGTPTPLLNGEAADVDAAVDALPEHLRLVVNVHWRDIVPDLKGRAREQRGATMALRAKACRCSVRSYYRWLDQAHARVLALMAARRVEAERARASYLNRPRETHVY